MKRALRNLLLALVDGFVLFCFSERIFWSVWRPGDSAGDLVVTWLAYATLAYLFLAVVRIFRVTDFGSLYLAGSVYGWLTEGGLIHTLYGTEESAPFPISLCITGLSWHALISAAIGWYATGEALTSARPTRTALVSTGVGVFWGLWATFLWHEKPPVITPIPQFLAYSAAITVLLAGAWWLHFRLGVSRFQPGWLGGSIAVLILGTFYVQHVLRLGWLPVIVLPAVLAASLLPLARARGCRTGRRIVTDGPLVVRNLPWLALTPVAATAAYAGAASLGLASVSIAPVVYYGITGPAGFVCWLAAVIQCLRRRPGGNGGAIQPSGTVMPSMPCAPGAGFPSMTLPGGAVSAVEDGVEPSGSPEI